MALSEGFSVFLLVYSSFLTVILFFGCFVAWRLKNRSKRYSQAEPTAAVARTRRHSTSSSGSDDHYRKPVISTLSAAQKKSKERVDRRRREEREINDQAEEEYRRISRAPGVESLPTVDNEGNVYVSAQEDSSSTSDYTEVISYRSRDASFTNTNEQNERPVDEPDKHKVYHKESFFNNVENLRQSIERTRNEDEIQQRKLNAFVSASSKRSKSSASSSSSSSSSSYQSDIEPVPMIRTSSNPGQVHTATYDNVHMPRYDVVTPYPYPKSEPLYDEIRERSDTNSVGVKSPKASVHVPERGEIYRGVNHQPDKYRMSQTIANENIYSNVAKDSTSSSDEEMIYVGHSFGHSDHGQSAYSPPTDPVATSRNAYATTFSEAPVIANLGRKESSSSEQIIVTPTHISTKKISIPSSPSSSSSAASTPIVVHHKIEPLSGGSGSGDASMFTIPQATTAPMDKHDSSTSSSSSSRSSLVTVTPNANHTEMISNQPVLDNYYAPTTPTYDNGVVYNSRTEVPSDHYMMNMNNSSNSFYSNQAELVKSATKVDVSTTSDSSSSDDDERRVYQVSSSERAPSAVVELEDDNDNISTSASSAFSLRTNNFPLAKRISIQSGSDTTSSSDDDDGQSVTLAEANLSSSFSGPAYPWSDSSMSRGNSSYSYQESHSYSMVNNNGQVGVSQTGFIAEGRNGQLTRQEAMMRSAQGSVDSRGKFTGSVHQYAKSGAPGAMLTRSDKVEIVSTASSSDLSSGEDDSSGPGRLRAKLEHFDLLEELSRGRALKNNGDSGSVTVTEPGDDSDVEIKDCSRVEAESTTSYSDRSDDGRVRIEDVTDEDEPAGKSHLTGGLNAAQREVNLRRNSSDSRVPPVFRTMNTDYQSVYEKSERDRRQQVHDSIYRSYASQDDSLA